jgi:hypothetical protein
MERHQTAGDVPLGIFQIHTDGPNPTGVLSLTQKNQPVQAVPLKLAGSPILVRLRRYRRPMRG